MKSTEYIAEQTRTTVAEIEDRIEDLGIRTTLNLLSRVIMVADIDAEKMIDMIKEQQYDEWREKLITRYCRYGKTTAEAETLLDALIQSHDGDNLEHALVYEGFATAITASRFVSTLR